MRSFKSSLTRRAWHAEVRTGRACDKAWSGWSASSTSHSDENDAVKVCLYRVAV